MIDGFIIAAVQSNAPTRFLTNIDADGQGLTYWCGDADRACFISNRGVALAVCIAIKSRVEGYTLELRREIRMGGVS